eukprot:3940993-Rhodomonas_salina.3
MLCLYRIWHSKTRHCTVTQYRTSPRTKRYGSLCSYALSLCSSAGGLCAYAKPMILRMLLQYGSL